MSDITDEKYVALTTYRKDGKSSTVPVWICEFDDGTIGMTTSSSSLKVKRLRRDARVQLQASDSRGNIKEGSTPVTGTATVVTGADFDRYRSQVTKKYGMQYRMIALFGQAMKLIGRGSGTDAAIVITPDP